MKAHEIGIRSDKDQSEERIKTSFLKFPGYIFALEDRKMMQSDFLALVIQ